MSQEIIRNIVKSFAQEGIFISEDIDEYPVRIQIADYINGKIEETKKILIGEPEDSIWWILKGSLLEIFYIFEEGFIDTLRVGAGSEEAARAYAFEKNAVDRWAGIIKGLSEDFLRLTAILGPLEKAGMKAFEKRVATQLSQEAEGAIKSYAGNMETVGKEALTPAEKSASEVVTKAVKGKAERVTNELLAAEKSGEKSLKGTVKSASRKTRSAKKVATGKTAAKKVENLVSSNKTEQAATAIEGEAETGASAGKADVTPTETTPTSEKAKSKGKTPESKRGIEAGQTAEKVWGEVLVKTRKNTRKYTVSFTDPLTKQNSTVDVIPDFMPTGKKDAFGMFLSAEKESEALLIADSKYVWDEAKNISLDNQIRAMLVLAKRNNVPFVFLLKESGGISKGVKEFAKALGVAIEVVNDTSGLIR